LTWVIKNFFGWYSDWDALSLIKFSQISIDKLHRNNTIKEKLNQITLNLKFLKKLKIQKFKKLKLIILKMIMKIKTIVIDYPFYNLNIPFVTNQLSDEVLNKLRSEREEEVKQKKNRKRKRKNSIRKTKRIWKNNNKNKKKKKKKKK